MPVTPALDDFNTGASQNLIAASRTGWDAGALWGEVNYYQTDATPTKVVVPTAVDRSALWGTSFAADQEAWVTFASAGNGFTLYARVTSVSSPVAYALSQAAGSTTVSLVKSPSFASIGSFVQAMSTGDTLALRCVGTTISAYYTASGGAESLALSVTDSVVTGAGQIGFDNASTAGTTSFDAFGGGAIVAAPSTPFRGRSMRR